MINFTIHRAITCWEKENQKKLDMWHYPDSFAKIIDDLEDSIETWTFYVTNLLKISNWNMSRLIDKDGKMRLPKAYLLIEVTVKNNLVLDWYPEKPALNYIDKTDFRYWSRYWDPSSTLPFNRIVMIHDIGWMRQRIPNENGMSHSDKYLLEAIHEHIHFIIDRLKELIDVELMSDMYFEYKTIPIPKGKSPSEVETKQLISFDILSIKEITEIENQKWLKQTFEEMGLSVDDFIKIFADVNGNKNKFIKALKEKGVNGLGEIRALKIINKLRNEFTEIFIRNHPGEMMNIKSKVVSISVKKQRH
jgi:hypothetical protein